MADDRGSNGPALVAIDLGAESCRVSLLRRFSGGMQIRLVHRFANQAVQRADGLRWDIDYILAGIYSGLRQCAELAPEGIGSLGVDGWAVDYVRLDASGAAIADPFCYRDERTVQSERALHESLSAERMRELTGIQIFRINTVYQMFADGGGLQQRPWLNLPEYVLFRLGGKPVSELTNATHTQMLGLDGRWSEEIFSALGQRLETAPPIVQPGTDIGRLTGELTELPAFTNTRLIAPACHDTASAVAAIPDAGDDWAYISSGTWSLVGTVLKAAINSEDARALNFTNLGGVDRTICFHKNVNGMWLLRQCMEAWNAESPAISLAALVESAASVAASDFVLDVDDPDLLLPGQMPQRINAQLRRRGLSELPVGPQHAPAIASFLFHSLAARYAEVLQHLSEITGKRFRRLYIMGGGSQNELLNRLTAKATGLDVCLVGTECSTRGNFAVQLATLASPGEGDGSERRNTSFWAGRLVLAEHNNPPNQVSD